MVRCARSAKPVREPQRVVRMMRTHWPANKPDDSAADGMREQDVPPRACARRSDTDPVHRSESDPPEGGSFYARSSAGVGRGARPLCGAGPRRRACIGPPSAYAITLALGREDGGASGICRREPKPQASGELPTSPPPRPRRTISEDWLRGRDLNPRPLGYEPNELPGCSTPRQVAVHRTRTASAEDEL